MSRRRRLIALFGLLGFAGLVLGATFSPYEGRWLTGFSGIPGIEDRLEDDARDMLSGFGIDADRITADGRDLTIETASELPGAVRNDLEGIDGVGRISYGFGASPDGRDDGDTGDDDLADGAGDDLADAGDDPDAAPAPTETTEPTAEPDPTATPVPAGGEVQMNYDGDTVRLAGRVQTAEGRDALLAAADRLVGADNVVDELQVTDGPGDDFDHVSSTASIMRRLGEWYDTANIALAGDQIVVSGEAADDSQSERARAVITQLAERVGLDATVDTVVVTAPDPVDDGDGTSTDTGDTGDTDGADGTGEDGSPAPDSSAVAAVVADLDLGAVEFQPGTAILTDQATAVLDDIAARLLDLPAVPIAIGGHTSNLGDPDVNLLLSDDRANAVRDHLIGQGVSADLLTATGFGASQPIADNSTDEGRAANERIELVVAEGNN